MKNKYVKTCSILLAAAMTMTGCGNAIPDMTEEEYQKVIEYAATTLLKYDANYQSRLVDLTTIEESEPAPTEENEENQEIVPETPPEETSEEQDTSVEETDQETINNTVNNLEEFYNLPSGISITYTNAETRNSYGTEEGSADSYFALDASEGKSLLVLHFTIQNGSSQEQNIDLFSKNTTYRVTVNGTETEKALTTMLLDDMSTYIDTIPAGESRDIVLIAEFNQAAISNITSISLNLKDDVDTYTMNLEGSISQNAVQNTEIPDTGADTPNAETEQTDVQIDNVVSDNLLIQAKMETADVMNGNGTEKVGERGYIQVSKSDLKQITEEDYKEFVESVVKDNTYNWFSIICEDGTGIHFTGETYYVAMYGKIDSEGRLEEQIGVISLGEDGKYMYQE